MKTKSCLIALSWFFALCAGCPDTALAQSSSAMLEGSWVLQASYPGGAFTSLASFASGGVFVATGSNDRVVPASELHGTWERWAGKNRYVVTAQFFAFAAPNGPAVALLKTNMVVQLTSKETLTAAGDLSSCDLTGNNCVPLPGYLSIQGKRIAAQASSILFQLLPEE